MEYTDTLGDRLKGLEQVEAGRAALFTQPLMARLDGRAFHTFTRGLNRPYDMGLSSLMIETTKQLVDKFHARLGYTQSDEITLFWWTPPTEFQGVRHWTPYLFDGKFQKLTSVLASTASAYFTHFIPSYLPSKIGHLGVFDCRVWNVPDMHEVYLNYLWRQDDAIKNSISMAAQAEFSHKQLHGADSETKKQWLREKGKPWEDQPEFFRMGSWVRRVTREVTLSEEQLNKIPEKHRPTGPVLRTHVEAFYPGYIKNSEWSKEFFV